MTKDDLRNVGFVMGKSKVVPRRRRRTTLSIPRLELIAAVMGANMHRNIKVSIQLPISKGYLIFDKLGRTRKPCHNFLQVTLGQGVAPVSLPKHGLLKKIKNNKTEKTISFFLYFIWLKLLEINLQVDGMMLHFYAQLTLLLCSVYDCLLLVLCKLCKCV